MPVPQASSILIIRPSALGDVARSVPVLASLRAAYPHARIDWLVREEFAPVLHAHPALTSVVPFPRRQLSQWLRTADFDALGDFADTLRAPRYDLVFDCQGLLRSGWMAWLTRAPRRIGYADARELSWLFLTDRVRTPPIIHTVDKALALLEHCGIPARRDPDALRLTTSPGDRAWLDAQPALAAGGYVLLAPTSAWPAKEWPVDRFAELARTLVSHGREVVIVAARNERARIAPLTALASDIPHVHDLTGATSIGQLMALIERAGVVVANDSASLHIAVGFGRPLVALLGPTDPRLACPFQRHADVLQHVTPGDDFYFRDDRSAGMIRRITTQEVLDAVLARIGTPGASVNSRQVAPFDTSATPACPSTGWRVSGAAGP